MEIAGVGKIVCYSVYLKDGVGISGMNVDILCKLSDHCKNHGLPFVVGGDWNNEPTSVINLDEIKSMQAKVICTKEPTCGVGLKKDGV